MPTDSQKVQNIKNIKDMKDTNKEPTLKLIDPNKNKNMNNNSGNQNAGNPTNMNCIPTNIIVQDPTSGQYQKLFACSQ
jgi:hypothetical protein